MWGRQLLLRSERERERCGWGGGDQASSPRTPKQTASGCSCQDVPSQPASDLGKNVLSLRTAEGTLSAQGQACQLEPLPPQVPADGGGQGAASLLLQKPLLSCVPHCYTQEVSRLCRLSAGTYRVVPSTYLPDTEGSFTVTIATRIDR